MSEATGYTAELWPGCHILFTEAVLGEGFNKYHSLAGIYKNYWFFVTWKAHNLSTEVFHTVLLTT